MTSFLDICGRGTRPTTCATCRLRSNAAWRSRMAAVYECPPGAPDFECPLGKPWSTPSPSPDFEARVSAELSALATPPGPAPRKPCPCRRGR